MGQAAVARAAVISCNVRAGFTKPLPKSFNFWRFPMRAEAQAHVDQINQALDLVRRFLDWDRALRKLDELNARVEDQALWNDPKAAQAVMRERRRLDEAISATRAIERECADTVELIELAEMEGDTALETEAVQSLGELAARAERDKIAALLAGEADGNDTYVEINAGAGGTESQDWAEMLQRMYRRWAERRGMKVELIDYHAGEQAGIKSATLLIKGENAYGYAMPRPKAACTGWSGSALMIPMRVGIPAFPASGSIRLWMRISILR
jgi:peptide chain release factor 2